MIHNNYLIVILEFHGRDKTDVRIEHFYKWHGYVVDMYNIDMQMYTKYHVHNRSDNHYYHKIDTCVDCYILHSKYSVNEQVFHSYFNNSRQFNVRIKLINIHTALHFTTGQVSSEHTVVPFRHVQCVQTLFFAQTSPFLTKSLFHRIISFSNSWLILLDKQDRDYHGIHFFDTLDNIDQE